MKARHEGQTDSDHVKTIPGWLAESRRSTRDNMKRLECLNKMSKELWVRRSAEVDDLDR